MESHSFRPLRFLKKLGSWFTTLLTIILVALWSVPVIWALVASFRPANDPISRGDVWFSNTMTIGNYVRAWSLAPFGQYYINTIIIVIMVLAVQLVTIVLAGFAFANYKFYWKTLDLFLCFAADDDPDNRPAGAKFRHHSSDGSF